VPKISQLPDAEAITGTEYVAIVQNGQTRKATASSLGGGGGGGAPTDASYVTLGTNATLTDERVLTAGSGTVAASGIVNANIDAAAAIALSKTALSANAQTFLGTPNSANLATLVTDETGSGSLVFATSPTLTTPNIGAATGTSLAASSFVSVGSNVATTGVVRLGSSGAIVGRNQANDTNVPMLEVTGTDQVQLGNTSFVTNIRGSTVQFRTDTFQVVDAAGSASRFRVTATGSVIIRDAGADNDLTLSVPNLGGDRTLSVPLLTGNDTLVTEAHTQTLSGKTVSGPSFAASSFLSVGATPATTGSHRLSADSTIKFRNLANDTDVGLFSYNGAGGTVSFGSFTGGTDHVTFEYRSPNFGYFGNTNTGTFFLANSAGPELACYLSSAKLFTISSTGYQFGSGGNDHGGGTGVIGIDNASANPSSNPTGGGILYADAGAGKWRGSSGTVTTFGPADLDGFKATSGEGHCPSCGTDFALEWANDAYGSLTVCMRCLTDALGDQPWIVRRPKKGAAA
jgi:hypothetical protein